MKLKQTISGQVCLNVGCGYIYNKDWNNIDLVKGNKDIIYHNVVSPFPFDNNSFDVVYSSHMLEHLNFFDARFFMQDVHRILKPGGICRIVVPDLEQIVIEYVRLLDTCKTNPDQRSINDYNWIVLELFDQMVREGVGGMMGYTLTRGRFNPDYVKKRIGQDIFNILDIPEIPNKEEFKINYPIHHKGIYKKIITKNPKTFLNALSNRIYSTFPFIKKVFTSPLADPRNTGEAHKWMYDQFSLKQLLLQQGFVEPVVRSYDDSAILGWQEMNLDKSNFGDYARKPDSLYMECFK